MPKRKQPAIPPATPGADAAAFWQEYVRQANEMLALMRGENARWWIYSVSMRTFELVIGEPTGKAGNVVLSAIGCQSIAGPTNWTMRAMEVVCLARKRHSVMEYATIPLDFGSSPRASDGIRM